MVIVGYIEIVSIAILYLFTTCYFKVIAFWNVTPCSVNILEKYCVFWEETRNSVIRYLKDEAAGAFKTDH